MNILAHNLAEPAYDADVAQLEYKLVPGDHGLVIRLKGFNHKLPVSMWLDRSNASKFQVLIDLTHFELFPSFWFVYLGLFLFSLEFIPMHSKFSLRYFILLFCVFTVATEPDCRLLGRLHFSC